MPSYRMSSIMDDRINTFGTFLKQQTSSSIPCDMLPVNYCLGIPWTESQHMVISTEPRASCGPAVQYYASGCIWLLKVLLDANLIEV